LSWIHFCYNRYYKSFICFHLCYQNTRYVQHYDVINRATTSKYFRNKISFVIKNIALRHDRCAYRLFTIIICIIKKVRYSWLNNQFALYQNDNISVVVLKWGLKYFMIAQKASVFHSHTWKIKFVTCCLYFLQPHFQSEKIKHRRS